MVNSISDDKFTSLKQQIDDLTVDEKLVLVSHVLKSSGLQVVMGGGNFISAEIVLQINSGSLESLTHIFDALARRLDRESINKRYS